MKTYRLYLGVHLNRIPLVEEFAPEGFTLFHGRGYWRGEYEDMTCVEFVGVDDAVISPLARAICLSYGQDAVLATASPCESQLFTWAGPLIGNRPYGRGRRR